MAEDGLAVVTSSREEHVLIAANQHENVAGHVENVILQSVTGDGNTISLHGGEAVAATAHSESTLHSLLTAIPGSRLLTTTQAETIQGETIQVISFDNSTDLASIAQDKPWQLQVLPGLNADISTAVIAVPEHSHEEHVRHEEHEVDEAMESMVTSTTMNPSHSLLMPPPPPPLPPPQPLPPGCPAWAARLRDCESIGDSYRGWVENENELDLLLSFHKQQTQSFWGTRQSPSPAKPSTRLMWKSQYVPFDGMPFVNSGSRAVVMECQYGPRRKGAQVKRQGEQMMKGEFKQTCPARIYIKKVKKYPEFRIDLMADKKSMKMAMDKAFQALKQGGFENNGMERFYVQLPTDKAHEFHKDSLLPEACVPIPHIRLHPKVVQKIRDLVSGGETRIYMIRKQLRRFVEKEVYDGQDCNVEKHNLTLYPTVNDLQNHVHQALKDIELGLLQVTAPTVNVEVITRDCHAPLLLDELEIDQGNWQSTPVSAPHAETVTVTLTQNPSEGGGHMISRVETHLSDGTTQVSSALTPETAHLLAKIHPAVFPPGNFLDGYQLQEASETNSDSQGNNLPVKKEGNTEDPDKTVTTTTANSASALQVIESNPRDTNPLQATSTIDPSQICVVQTGNTNANSATLQLVQQNSDGATLQIVQGTTTTPLEFVPSSNSEPLHVMHNQEMIQVIPQAQLSNELHVVENSGSEEMQEGEASQGQEQSEHITAGDSLVSINMEHESSLPVLNQEIHFQGGEDED